MTVYFCSLSDCGALHCFQVLFVLLLVTSLQTDQDVAVTAQLLCIYNIKQQCFCGCTITDVQSDVICFCPGVNYKCALMCVCEYEGGERVSEAEKPHSSACLSGQAIQHREKLFIQHRLPTPPSKLPSNSVGPELTRWHGSITRSPPPFCPPQLCLFFTSFSSFSFCLSLLSSSNLCTSFHTNPFISKQISVFSVYLRN